MLKLIGFHDLFFFFFKDCRAISMGQGQEIHARKLVGQFMQTVGVFLFYELIGSEAEGATMATSQISDMTG